jgi:hypothetical protein
MGLKLANITMDCEDAAAVAAFWAEALGKQVDEGASDFFATIDMTDRSTPTWMFVQVPEPKSAKNRTHVDLEADDRMAEVSRLERLGAVVVDHKDDWNFQWTVMNDPFGNEFCVSGPHAS